MHKRFALTLLFVSLVLAPCRAGFGQAAQARRDIEAAIRESNASLMRQDAQGAMKFLAPDFEFKNIQGNTYNQTQFKQISVKYFSYARFMHANTKVESVLLKGDGATVLSKEHVTLKILAGRPPKIHTVTLDSRLRGLWVQTKDGWRLKQSKQLSLTVTTDGVPKVFRPKSTK